jgi:hypothetical protein
MRWATALILTGFLAVPGFAAPPVTAAEEMALIQAAGAKIDAKDEAAALPMLQEAIAAPGYDQIDDKIRYFAQHLLAAVALDTGDKETARQASRIASASTYADHSDWVLRCWASIEADDKADAAASMTILAGMGPQALNDFKPDTIYRVVRDANDAPEGGALRLKLIKTLFASHWLPVDEAAENADGLWLDLLRHDLEVHDVAEAQTIASRIVHPDIILAMNADRSFDPVVNADPAHFDIAKAYAAAVERAKARIAAAPDLLAPSVDAAMRLYQLGRLSEARTILEVAMSKAAAGTQFKDKDDQLNWIFDQHARVLLALGRSDDGIAAMKAGIRTGEDGNANVSQIINLADTYYALGRPKEALVVLAQLDSKFTSPYGAMSAEEARACSYAQLGDKENLGKSLTFIREHAAAAPGVALQALICSGDMEEAAKLAVKFLSDPDKRDSILERLHHHKLPPSASPLMIRLDQRWKALGEREDVRQAVASFGRILNLPVLALW